MLMTGNRITLITRLHILRNICSCRHSMCITGNTLHGYNDVSAGISLMLIYRISVKLAETTSNRNLQKFA